MNRQSNERRRACTICLVFLCLYLLTYKGLTIEDGALHYEVARNYVTRGTFSLPKEDFVSSRDTVFWKKGQNDETYLTLPPGLTLLAIPGCALGLMVEKHLLTNNRTEKVFSRSLPAKERARHFQLARKKASVFLSFLINPLAVAVTLAFLYLFLIDLGTTSRKAMLVTIATGLSTNLWYFATTDWTQPLTLMFLFVSFFLVHKSQFHESFCLQFLGGLCLGLATIVRYDTLLALPWILLFMLVSRGKEDRPPLRFGGTFLFLVGLSLSIGLILSWNYHRFGNPFDTGSQHQHLSFLFGRKLSVQLPVALVANCFSPKQGLLFYSPLLFLVFCTAKSFYSRHRRLAISIGGLVLTNYLFFSAFILWQTPESWGPRFLVVVVPFLALTLKEIDLDERAMRKSLVSLFVIGLCFQLCAASHPMRMKTVETIELFSIARPELSSLLNNPVVPHCRDMFGGDIEIWWLDAPESAPFAFLLFSIGYGAFLKLTSAPSTRMCH